MRAVRLTAEAEATFGGQIDNLLEQGAIAAAQALKDGVEAFLVDTLATYPRTGHYIRRRRLWETWIPRHPHRLLVRVRRRRARVHHLLAHVAGSPALRTLLIAGRPGTLRPDLRPAPRHPMVGCRQRDGDVP